MDRDEVEAGAESDVATSSREVDAESDGAHRVIYLRYWAERGETARTIAEANGCSPLILI